ncbi:dolichyl-phosphate-mannose--protein mannosyltransferase [Roseofilum casamattae]|uniref:Polyprenol-phosphate-mannose--protein mannosyltransferase n=1 Tax=Roseofilum casamattae BLCC-M143 TaxID=3022442 RepID=A0ABT7BZB6_9CYAN|nr:phospholipid carrier-dependent glycosyltransferase [Roseofilum casamattae]MDJ1184132.1 phospholipid carrier-dependent glycosyltransferase [Roseofilum casamattae BLCC-M143]
MSIHRSLTFFPPLPWFRLGLVAIWIIALCLRFWGLSRFNTLVFDEVYFAKFAQDYLSRNELFDGHPPLGKYAIALGMWISDRISMPQNFPSNDLTGMVRSTFSYRWFNALTGSFIPLIVAAITEQLYPRRSYGLLAAGLITLDGLFLVESRYGLINIYLVLFGLLAHYLALLGLRSQNPSAKAKNAIAFTLSGMSFGLCAAVKWNGLGFWLGWMALVFIANLRQKIQEKRERQNSNLWFDRIPTISIWKIGLYWIILPYIVYAIAWIPHLQLNPDYNFWENQQQLLGYHQSVGTGSDIHPYCSSWLSWPLLLRPIAYYYQTANNEQLIFDVHAFGNPLLWWSASVAIAILLPTIFLSKKSPILSSLALYLTINYAANWLPWSLVSRCTFLYHYMSALIFSILALALICDRSLASDRLHHKLLAISSVTLFAIAFIFWLPIYLGLPLTPQEFHWRMWFNGWI